MSLLEETLGKISPPDRDAMNAAALRWKNLYLGMGNLGKLEDMVTRYVGVVGDAMPEVPRGCMVIACADHGVYRQGVSAYPQETTVGMVRAYAAGGASANAMAHFGRLSMVIVDVGIAADMSKIPGVLDKKIAWGTEDISEGPAMRRRDAVRALEIGIEIAEEKVREGYRVFTIGEMGISNTTSAACILGAFNHWNAAEVTGRGTNISDERLMRKVEVVQRALDVNQPDAADGLDVLSKVGGFEFGCMAGVILGAIGVYEPIARWGGAGATVPLTGFGYSLYKGVADAVATDGWLGALTGGLSATAGGIAAAVLFGFLAALVFRPGEKR